MSVGKRLVKDWKEPSDPCQHRIGADAGNGLVVCLECGQMRPAPTVYERITLTQTRRENREE